MKKTILFILIIAASIPCFVLSLQKQIEIYKQRLSTPISEKAKTQLRAEIKKLEAQLEAQGPRKEPARVVEKPIILEEEEEEEVEERRDLQHEIDRLANAIDDLLIQIHNSVQGTNREGLIDRFEKALTTGQKWK